VFVGLGLFSLLGCGASQNENVNSIARDFHDAMAAGDGAAACAVLAPVTRSELEQSVGTECRLAILEEKIPQAEGDAETAVFDTMARVEYGDDIVFLTRMPDGWRVLAAGCTPRAVGPDECLLKGA
jgi:hypothetical protein